MAMGFQIGSLYSYLHLLLSSEVLIKNGQHAFTFKGQRKNIFACSKNICYISGPVYPRAGAEAAHGRGDGLQGEAAGRQDTVHQDTLGGR